MTPAGAGLRLVKDHGWDVHHAVHECFGELLDVMTGVEDPVRFLAWTLPLRHNLHHHMRFEDEHVLPLAARVLPDPPPNGTTATFLEDHRLIRERLDRLFDLSLQRVHRPIDAALPLECLAVLDDLMEHHDQRETEYLYGPLGGRLDAAGRQDVLDRLGATPLVTVEQVRDGIERWCDSGLMASLLADYGAWVNDLPPGGEATTDLDAALGDPAAATYRKLRERDARLVITHRGATFERQPARLQSWRRVEQTLRTTVRFALEAALARLPGLRP